MVFDSPIWLIALVPWLALALWLFQGRRPQAGVPFLALWQSPAPVAQPRRKLQVLPLAVLLAVLAAGCCIVAGTRPSIPSRHAAGAFHLTLVVDRGMSMSARSKGEPRYVQAVRSLVDSIPPGLRSADVELVTVPGDDPVRATLAECAGVVGKLAPTARDTRPLLPEIVSARLAAGGGPVIVVSDKKIGPNERLIQVPPDGQIDDVAIALLAARQTPASQVMVRVRNQSPLRSAELIVSSGKNFQRQTIDLPDAGRTRDYFVNAAGLGPVITAALAIHDDIAADDAAWLVREGSWPRIEPMTRLDPALQRLIEVYQRSRPPTDESSRLPLIADAAQLPADKPAVVVSQSRGSPASGAAQIDPHSITAHVDWDQLPREIEVSANFPQGWTPLVSVGGRAIVAVRPAGPRQVWVGFDAPNWSRTPDYVVFWTNVFDWAGGGGEQFVAHSLSDWTPQWKPTEAAGAGMWPGLYRRSDGALRAFNAPDVILAPPPQTNWRAQLASLRASAGRLDLCGPLLVAAAALLVLAAMMWKRRGAPTMQHPANSVKLSGVPSVRKEWGRIDGPRGN